MGATIERYGNVGPVLQEDAVTPSLNALYAEVALQLELNRWDCLIGDHVSLELNVYADKLSRLWDDVTVSQVFFSIPEHRAF